MLSLVNGIGLNIKLINFYNMAVEIYGDGINIYFLSAYPLHGHILKAMIIKAILQARY